METVGQSWDILIAILGHKYQITQTGPYLVNEANICKKSDFDYTYTSYSLQMGESSVHDRLFCQHREACTVTQKLDLDQMSERGIRMIRTLMVTNMIKLTFCCKLWHDSLWMILMTFVA